MAAGAGFVYPLVGSMSTMPGASLLFFSALSRSLERTGSVLSVC